MSFLAKAQHGGDVFIILDVGSGSVGGAIVLFSGSRAPTILYSIRMPLPFMKEATGSRLYPMLWTVSQLVRILAKEGFEKGGFQVSRPYIREVLVSLSAPWVISKTFFLNVRAEKPMKISVPLFESLLKESEEKAEKEGSLRGAEEIEKKLVKSVLNGYETDAPYGKTATEAEFAVLSGFSLPKLTEAISSIVTNQFHSGHLTFHSFSMLAFTTIRDLFGNTENFIFLDVSGEQTEVSIVKKSVVVETISFPAGKNHLIRALVDTAGFPAAGAETAIKFATDTNGHGTVQGKAKAAISEFQQDWLAHFSRSLETFSQELFLSRNLFLTADAFFAPIITQAITSGDFTKLTVSSSPFEATVIDESLLAPYVHINPEASADVFLLIVTIFAANLRIHHRQSFAG